FNDFEGFRLCHNIIVKETKKMNDIGYKCDGIIYNSSGGYFNKVFRWKLVKTVDFLFENNKLKLFRKSDNKFIDFFEVSETELEIDKSNINNIKNNCIVECIIQNDKILLLKERPDKNYPNPVDVV